MMANGEVEPFLPIPRFDDRAAVVFQGRAQESPVIGIVFND
jgi:hypothetical protein